MPRIQITDLSMRCAKNFLPARVIPFYFSPFSQFIPIFSRGASIDLEKIIKKKKTSS